MAGRGEVTWQCGTVLGFSSVDEFLNGQGATATRYFSSENQESTAQQRTFTLCAP